MKKSRSALLFFVLLVLGVSWAIPAEDVLDTAYDESEALPYEGTSLITDVISQAPATIQAVRHTLRFQAHPSLVPAMRVNGTEAQRSADAPVALALLCTLRC